MIIRYRSYLGNYYILEHIIFNKESFPDDRVLDKGWKLGARRHKIKYNFFSIGDPPKIIMVVEFTTSLVDSSYLGCPM